MKKSILGILFLTCVLGASAQVYEDMIYQKEIRTVLFYNENQEQSLPLMQLNSGEKLLLSFDDIATDYFPVSYTVVHCDANWTESNLVPMDYMTGFNENPINNYRFSYNTLERYVHYELELPNNDVSLLLTGNYVLKVFAQGDPDQLLFTRRFMVYRNTVSIDALINRTSVVSERNKKQKLDITVNHQDVRIDNPFSDIKVVVMQNGRWDNAKYNTKPSFIRTNQLVYDNVDANIFDGLNEFRKFDIRSMRFLSERMARIDREDRFKVYLLDDKVKSSERYVSDIDMNGNFFIRRLDGGKSELEGDYVDVHFSLDYGAQNPYGNFYVVGKFNDWRISDDSKMTYKLSSRRYETTLFLKQGVYDYMYVFVANNATLEDATVTEGSFFDTENDYLILVYQRRTGSRYDELIGMRKLQTITR